MVSFGCSIRVFNGVHFLECGLIMGYNTTKEQAEKHVGDKNYCTVLASSIFFNADYDETHKIYSENGRVNGKGLKTEDTKRLIKIMGKKHNIQTDYYYSYYNKKWTGKRYKKHYRFGNKAGDIFLTMSKKLTLHNFNDYLPTGNYIFGVHGHVLAVKNGTIEDWTEIRDKHRVIYEIWAEKYPEFIEDEEINYSSLC